MESIFEEKMRSISGEGGMLGVLLTLLNIPFATLAVNLFLRAQTGCKINVYKFKRLKDRHNRKGVAYLARAGTLGTAGLLAMMTHLNAGEVVSGFGLGIVEDHGRVNVRDGDLVGIGEGDLVGCDGVLVVEVVV